jgi:hypothetical protein
MASSTADYVHLTKWGIVLIQLAIATEKSPKKLLESACEKFAKGK